MPGRSFLIELARHNGLALALLQVGVSEGSTELAGLDLIITGIPLQVLGQIPLDLLLGGILTGPFTLFSLVSSSVLLVDATFQAAFLTLGQRNHAVGGPFLVSGVAIFKREVVLLQCHLQILVSARYLTIVKAIHICNLHIWSFSTITVDGPW